VAAAVAVLAGAVLLGATWALPSGTVLGAAHTDMAGQFVAWRAFAADSLRYGELPLWNPYTYAGQPFLGGFQSALLYPPNLIFLVLPLERAINFAILAHLLLLGWGVYAWASRRGFARPAALACAIGMPLSGVVFPHVYAGHLSNLCTLAWAPWMFAGLEQAWRGRSLAGLLLASAAICLQILAGHVQYVFFLAIAAGLHALVASGFDASVRARALPAVAVAGILACTLAAAQLFPGLAAGAEGVRQGRLEYAFAASFSLPPENLLTAVAPGFFGDTLAGAQPYWGRCYPWEMSLYIGVAGIAFALLGVWRRYDATESAAATRPSRAREDLTVAGLLLLLALGRHLPLHAWLYEWVPGFGHFRGMSKFTFPAMLFAMMAAGAGMDALIRGRVRGRVPAIVALAAAAGLGLLGFWLRLEPAVIERLFGWVSARAGDDLMAPPTFPPGGALYASWSLLRASALCAVIGTGVLLAGLRPLFGWLAVAVLPLETLHFAKTQFATMPVSAAMPEELREFISAQGGDYRVLNLLRPNNGYLLGAPDLWGNDPGVLKRYAEFMTFTQGGNPDAATQNLAFTVIPPIYSMLRTQFAFVPTAAGADVKEVPDPMRRVQIVPDYRVLSGRDAMFAELVAPGFNPRTTVLLEREPNPRPAGTPNSGSAWLISASSSSLTIGAEVAAPALLLITDLYSRDWHARPLPGSVQATYEILPANYVLRAIPLAAGQHRIEVVYAPRSFRVGLAVSAIAWLAWACGVAMLFLRSRRVAPAGLATAAEREPSARNA
jgi:hypothetical protein